MIATGLSILIVTDNAADDVGTCLSLVTESRIGRGCEVIVIDNASIDGTPELIAARFPEVRLIAQGENHGVSGAHAIGFAASRGAYLLLLSPDVLLTDPDAVAAMAARLDAHPDLGAIGARPDGGHRAGDAGGWRGVCVMMRREAVFAIGGLDGEGIGWRGRLEDAGWRVGDLPDVAARCLRGGSAGNGDQSVFSTSPSIHSGCVSPTERPTSLSPL